MRAKRWAFLAAAVVPCAVLLLFCAVTVHEWWLISTNQIVVTPRPSPGVSSVPEVPAERLLPIIVGSGLLAAGFAFAAWRRSRAGLVSAYLALVLVALLPLLRRML